MSECKVNSTEVWRGFLASQEEMGRTLGQCYTWYRNKIPYIFPRTKYKFMEKAD